MAALEATVKENWGDMPSIRIPAIGNMTPVAIPIAPAPTPATWDRAGYERMVNTLPDDQVREILIAASENSVFAQTAIRFWHEINKRKEAVRIVDFDHYSQDADYIIDKKYTSGGGSREYEMAGDAVHDLEEIIEKIENDVKEARPPLSYESKKSALDTLCKIGDSIVGADSSTLGSEVQKSFQRDYQISGAMCSILKSMTAEERQRVAQSGGLMEKVEDLEGSADGYGMTMELEKVLELLHS